MVPLRPLIVPIMASLDAAKPGSIFGTVAAGDVGCPGDTCAEGRLELGSWPWPWFKSCAMLGSRFKLVGALRLLGSLRMGCNNCIGELPTCPREVMATAITTIISVMNGLRIEPKHTNRTPKN